MSCFLTWSSAKTRQRGGEERIRREGSGIGRQGIGGNRLAFGDARDEGLAAFQCELVVVDGKVVAGGLDGDFIAVGDETRRGAAGLDVEVLYRFAIAKNMYLFVAYAFAFFSRR